MEGLIYPTADMQRIDAMEEKILEALGPAEAFEAVSRASGYREKDEIYQYIIRMYDLDDDEEEE